MGFFWEKNYLIVLQNNYERRPSGGFISSYAIVKTFLWKVDLEIKDSYDISSPSPKIEPPYPLNEILSTDKFYEGWVFRDANWSPDFTVSANNIISFYDKSEWKLSSFDWVVAVDMEILKSLLEFTWEINVDNTIFNSNNYYYLTQILSKNIDLHDIEALKTRKNFLKSILKKISAFIITNPFKINDLIANQKTLLDNKHIQIFFSNPALQKKIEQYWWAWKFKPKTEDFIHINFANIWWRKSDRYISQLNQYDLTFNEKWEAIWNLNITLKHRWTKSLISDFYQAYVRIYLPKNIKLISSKSSFKDKNSIYVDLDSFVVSWIIHMHPWESSEINIKYKLPKIIKANDYNLEIITQSGQENENWHITVQNITDHFWSWNMNSRENLAFFDWSITSNKIFNLKDEWDEIPPIVVWQRFVKNDVIEVNFSEKISLEFMKNLKNIKITDKNKINKKTDTINVTNIEFRNNSIFISLWGISYQTWEHYRLILNNIMDGAGNFTNPSPLDITVVQR